MTGTASRCAARRAAGSGLGSVAGRGVTSGFFAARNFITAATPPARSSNAARWDAGRAAPRRGIWPLVARRSPARVPPPASPIRSGLAYARNVIHTQREGGAVGGRWRACRLQRTLALPGTARSGQAYENIPARRRAPPPPARGLNPSKKGSRAEEPWPTLLRGDAADCLPPCPRGTWGGVTRTLRGVTR